MGWAASASRKSTQAPWVLGILRSTVRDFGIASFQVEGHSACNEILEGAPKLPHQKGFATFLVSVSPVIGSLNSFQLIGCMILPASLFAMMTPNSFLAVVR